MKTGVIGLGQIGGGVAICLARAGQLSGVYDMRKDAADALEGVPPVLASPAELARVSDAIVIAVVTAQQTIDVLSGEDGVLAGSRPGQSIILVATVSLEDLARIRALTDAKGVDLLDSGVVGGFHSAQNGLMCLVGAEQEALDRAKPAFDGFARYVVHLGGPGTGMSGKVIYNAIYATSLCAGREVAKMATAAGVDAAKLERVFQDASDSVGGPLRFVASPVDPAIDTIAFARREEMNKMLAKDLDAALGLAKSHGVALPMVEHTRRNTAFVVGISGEEII